MSAGGAPPCVLVAEDEMVVAMMLEGMLKDLGYRVVKAARVERAASLAAKAEISAAILDVNLAGQPSYPVAEALRLRGIPFAFASGYVPGSLRGDFRGVPTLRKPYTAGDVRRALAEVLGSSPRVG